MHLNITGLGKKSGVDYTLIGRYERGDSRAKTPKIDKLLALAEALTRPGHDVVDTLADLLGKPRKPAVSDQDRRILSKLRQLDEDNPVRIAIEKMILVMLQEGTDDH